AKGGLEIILRPGVSRAAGAALDAIGAPVARSRSDIAFSATSSAVVTTGPNGDAVVVVASGDPLPAPFAGAFTEVSSPTLADDGRVVFSGSGTGGVVGLFAWGGSIITTPDATAGGAGSGHAPGAIASGWANRIRLWDHATRTSAVVVTARDPILGPERVRLRAPTLADSGVLAFVAQPRGRRDVTGGVFGWTAATG